ncbi:MAG: elongation factor G [Spirochaetaceae bacterium 4572_59]|nr:MAG: elongation factor G [Spirochaetaceae bacterium 4572_59]
MTDITKMRNIGISAHIDSGKTTLTERILFYCQKIHAIHEVRGKDGVGATMDSMELEKERGITIASAATNVTWKEHDINIIDTPGHVDFTIEVERALRVLDGAVLVLCSVGGVQSQSITVDRQLKRYGVPRIAFINKSDRTGANPYKVCDQLREKLDLNSVMMQVPIGLEEKLEGVIDLVRMVAIYFDGDDGEQIRIEEIPSELKAEADERRELMLDAVSMFNEDIMEKMMEEEDIPEDMLHETIRKAVIAQNLVPVYLGSAYKNKGIQELMDAVIRYLPSPPDVENKALDLDDEEKEVILPSDASLPPVALAFKLEDGQYGQLTYIRVYQGVIKKGADMINVRNGRKFKVGRLVRMHSNNMEDITEAPAGDIVALFGIECASGDTFCDSSLNLSMTSMFVPNAVISLSIRPVDKSASDKMAKALNRFTKEDPTFRTHVDPESNETIVSGMGELHLEVYIERMKREYQAEVITGAPQVAYREAISMAADFNYTHKKQTGGSGQYARIAGRMEPLKNDDEKEYEFENKIKGGSIPTEYIPSCDKGFQTAMLKGSLIGAPVVGVKMTVTDGQFHPVDSSDQAFQTAGLGAFREAYKKAKPVILEPIMKVSVEGPTEFQGNIFGTLNQRRGMIVASNDEGSYSTVEAEVPLSEMFGYSTVLRSSTQGKAEFTMEFAKYGKVPSGVTDELIKKYEEEKKRAQQK